MLLKYFYDKKLAQASYLVGCAATGEALLIDPSRDIQQYIDAAQEEGLTITHVTETHIHADFVSGSRELGVRTGARIYLSDMGTEDWKYGYISDGNVVLVRDGDAWMVGNVRVEVIHTPGHTPEHISFMITDTAGANQPIGVFTGDFLFVGDIGRPDLLEEAAGIKGTKEPGARQQFQSVKRFADMPDYLQVWPGHGAGSACGKALGAIPSTTLGYEKLFNPAFQFDNEEDFVNWLLEGQPEAPRYFAQMKHVNKAGPVLLSELGELVELDRASLDASLAEGDLVIDTRSREAFAKAHVPGTINIPADDGGFVTNVGWFVDYNEPIYIIAEHGEKAHTILTALRSIGVDNLSCYFSADVLKENTSMLEVMNSTELAQRVKEHGLVILDVRGASEYHSQHIKGARHIPLGYLPQYVRELPLDSTIVTHCASGYRSQIAASVLRRYGFEKVINLNDGIDSWAGVLATEQG